MPEEHQIEVTVNDKSVSFEERRRTGLEIKQSAVDQGVNIQLDFSLYIIEGDSPLKPVADSESIEIHNKEAFKAVASDDTSR